MGIEEFWNLMENGQKSLLSTDYTGLFSNSMEVFARKFGIEVSSGLPLDPHEAMLLQSTRDCLENGGFHPSLDQHDAADWGVFVGLPSNVTGTVASHIARFFNFTGPTMDVHTACPSLSALDVAYLNLKLNRCTAAIVSGARIILDPNKLYNTEGAFKQGEGCGTILLMSVGKARVFNRRILAIVKGTYSSDDGVITNQLSQTKLLQQAISKAGLSRKEVVYVEADTKGSKLGGVMEMDSIQQAFKLKDKDGTHLVVGSTKTNIGDLGVASGIVGLIKTVMVLDRAQAPGNPHWDITPEPTDPNQKLIAFPKEMCDLPSPRQGKLMSAAVNSFGDAGANKVAVLQQYGTLPHMIGVSCWLVLGADHLVGDKSWLVHEVIKTSSHCMHSEIFVLLKKNPIVLNALTYFNQIFDITCQKYSFNPREKKEADFKVTVLKLYYGLVAQLSSIDAKIAVLGSTNVMNEISALLFAGSIDLSAAIRLMSYKHDPVEEKKPKKDSSEVSKKEPREKSKLKQQAKKYVELKEVAEVMKVPKVPVFSSVRNQILDADTFKDEESILQYALDLAANIGKANNSTDCLQFLLNKKTAKPLLLITSEEITPEKSSVIAISFKKIREVNSSKYLRSKYLSLRSLFDKSIGREARAIQTTGAESTGPQPEDT